MTKILKISIGIIAILLLSFIILKPKTINNYSLNQLPVNDKEFNQALGETQITTQNWENLVGTTEIGVNSVSTTTAKTTGTYTSYYANTNQIGQFDIGCQFTPYESDTELNMVFYSGSDVNGSCNHDDIMWYKDAIETIGSATSTAQGYIWDWEKDTGVNFVASTTYSVMINRDKSNTCSRVDIKENNVSSSYGNLICQIIKSN